jgi:phosphohistidine phosphatase
VELALLRHGVAEDAGPEDGEEARALTPDGAERMRLAAAGMASLGLRPEVVLTSPLVRCRETAEIVAEALGGEVVADDRLAPGMGLDELAGAVAIVPEAARVMVCGHQPELSQVAAALLGGGRVEFQKGALVVLEAGAVRPGSAYLRAAYPPSTLRLLAGPST